MWPFFLVKPIFRLERGRVFKYQVAWLVLESASLDSPGIIAWPIYSPNPVRRNFWTTRVFLGDILNRVKQFEWRSSGPATYLFFSYSLRGKAKLNWTELAQTQPRDTIGIHKQAMEVSVNFIAIWGKKFMFYYVYIKSHIFTVNQL